MNKQDLLQKRVKDLREIARNLNAGFKFYRLKKNELVNFIVSNSINNSINNSSDNPSDDMSDDMSDDPSDDMSDDPSDDMSDDMSDDPSDDMSDDMSDISVKHIKQLAIYMKLSKNSKTGKTINDMNKQELIEFVIDQKQKLIDNSWKLRKEKNRNVEENTWSIKELLKVAVLRNLVEFTHNKPETKTKKNIFEMTKEQLVNFINSNGKFIEEQQNIFHYNKINKKQTKKFKTAQK